VGAEEDAACALILSAAASKTRKNIALCLMSEIFIIFCFDGRERAVLGLVLKKNFKFKCDT
jgi:hypothetical protein